MSEHAVLGWPDDTPIVTRIRALSKEDSLDDFDCSEPALDSWLTRRAWTNEQAGYSRTFVTFGLDDKRLAGYYCLCAAALKREEVPGAENPPRQIPAVLLGRMAVKRELQGRGVGGYLVKHAVVRSLHISKHAGARFLVVDAKNERLALWYERIGFQRVDSPDNLYRLVLDLPSARLTIGQGP
jgi:GNAT superfamily N-acetyltransferase